MLTIAIPTFNRANKLRRLLNAINDEILTSQLQDRIAVMVSDNASTDDTSKMVSELSKKQSKFSYFRQSKNLGFDGNIRFLYEQAKTEYIWFFADDDIILPGSISTVIQALQNNNPDVLLFSFIQPPGSKVKTFNYSNRVEVITDPAAAIEVTHKYPKVSIYVLRNISLNSIQQKELKLFLGNGFYFIDLAYSVLEASKQLKLCVISEPLATCDEDYIEFNFDPQVFLEMYKVFYHPFVLKHLPSLPRSRRDSSYYNMVQFLFAVKTGSLIVDDFQLYDQAIKNVEIRMVALLKNPRTLIQLALMKIGLVNIYLKIRPLINMARRVLEPLTK